jgi:hypothetical protein
VRKHLFLVAVVAMSVVVARPARADDPAPPTSPAQLPERKANFAWDKKPGGVETLLRASFSYEDVLRTTADPTGALLKAKLSNGLSNTVVMRAYLFETGTTSPIALAAKACNITYDVWDEVYRIKLTSSEGTRDPKDSFTPPKANIEGVLKTCAEAQDLPIVDRSLLANGSNYFLAVIVDVNPVSGEMLAQLQKWVQRPMGSTALAPGNALFGAFVGLFVKSIGTSDRTLQFRTQAFAP